MHIQLRFLSFQDLVAAGLVRLRKTCTKDHLADLHAQSLGSDWIRCRVELQHVQLLCRPLQQPWLARYSRAAMRMTHRDAIRAQLRSSAEIFTIVNSVVLRDMLRCFSSASNTEVCVTALLLQPSMMRRYMPHRPVSYAATSSRR